MNTPLFVYKINGCSCTIANTLSGTLTEHSMTEIEAFIRSGYTVEGVQLLGNQISISEASLIDFPYKCTCGRSMAVTHWQDVAFDMTNGQEIVIGCDVVITMRYGRPVYNLSPVISLAAQKLNTYKGSILLTTINKHTPRMETLVQYSIDTSCLGAICTSCGKVTLPQAFIPAV